MKKQIAAVCMMAALLLAPLRVSAKELSQTLAMADLTKSPEFSEILENGLTESWLEAGLCDGSEEEMVPQWEKAVRVEICQIGQLTQEAVESSEYRVSEHLVYDERSGADHTWVVPVAHGGHTDFLYIARQEDTTRAELDERYPEERYNEQNGWTPQELEQFKQEILAGAGKWQGNALKTSTDDQDAASVPGFSYLADREGVLPVLEEAGLTDPDEIRFFYIAHRYGVLLIEQGGEEYIVQQASNPGYAGMENGQVYPARDYLRTLIEQIGEEEFSSDNAGGLTGGGSSEKANPLPLWSGAALAAVLTAALGVAVRVRVRSGAALALAGAPARSQVIQRIRSSSPRPGADLSERIWRKISE